MFPLYTKDALALVRKNLDEQAINDSDMIDMDDRDSDEFESVLRKTLPEAVNIIHTQAPVEILDGERLTSEEILGVSIEDDVLCFGTKKEMLRLVAFKASDSDLVVAEPVAEYSAEGRMQLNPYTRGTNDRPRLVLMQGKDGDFLSSFRYYSLDRCFTEPAEAIEKFEYIPRYRFVESLQDGPYRVAENVVENIIDQLTGMMLAIYNNQRADYFFTKASFNK